MQQNLNIRTMQRADLETAIAWADAEAWNPGKFDADAFFATDPNGYYIGEYDGKAVSCISAVAYGTTFGFIGFYIVRPEFRGKGYGLATWNHALRYLEKRNIGLDGVTAQQQNYTKSGFQLAYHNMRFEGVGGGELPKNVVELKTLPFAQIHAYDAPFFPDDRTTFLQKWLQMPHSTALGVVQEKNLKGYAVLRPCTRGYKIGPLFADNENIAETLFQALSSHAPNAPIYLDIPEPNTSALALAKRHKLQLVFETARMYTQNPPNLPLSRLYGVTTFELG